MRNMFVPSILAVVLATSFTAPSFAKSESKDDMVKAANALDEAFLAAFNSGNAEAMSALYWNSPDAVSFPPDVAVARGIDSIRTANAATLKAGAKLEITESHQMVFGEVVVGWGFWRYTLPMEGGAPIEATGRYSDVKAKRDGKWVYLIDHASVMPPSAAASDADAAKD